KNFFELYSVSGVGRVNDERFATQILDGFDVRLGDEFVLRAFATHDDDDVLVGEVDHGHGVVHGKIGDVAIPGGEFVAQLLRIGGVFGLHFEAKFGKEAKLFCGNQLERAAEKRKEFDFDGHRFLGDRSRPQIPKCGSVDTL